MKAGRSIVVVDWTHSDAHVGVFAESLRGLTLRSAFSMSTRSVVRNEITGAVCTFVGPDAVGMQNDERTIVFEHLSRDLPNIDDADLQTELMKGFWRALYRDLSRLGISDESHAPAVYVIPPVRFPTSLLETFRASCPDEIPVRPVGFTNAAAALVLGFLCADEFPSDLIQTQDAEQSTVCLIVAGDELTVDVACFDYKLVFPKQHRVLIRDLFRTTRGDLLSRLHDCDWRKALTILVLIEDPALTDSAKARMVAACEAVAGPVPLRRRESSAASQLNLSGGAQVARFAAGRATHGQEYELILACNLGLQINYQRFHPIVSKESWLQLHEFPHYRAQLFKLSGDPRTALRLNLCCGYSTRLADATPLGQATLSQSDLTAVRDATLTAAIRLDTRASGEFLLGVMPANRVLRRQRFILPGLVV